MTEQSAIFCAIDTPDPEAAMRLAEKLKGKVAGIKLGLEFFMANGPQAYRPFKALGMPIFVDVKLHDIPNTVAGSIKSLLPIEPDFITLHTSGGAAMMKAAAEAAREGNGKQPKLLGVTVLTSLDAADLEKVGQDADTVRQVQRLALLAKESGLDGVVCSPKEIGALREVCGPDFILMVPGIRPTWAGANDQKRVMTPREAMAAGATYMVIGRPITGDADPAAAAVRINEETAAPKGGCCGCCCGK